MKYVAQKCKERKRVILVCSLGAVVSRHSLFLVSYRWRAGSYYKGCRPSGRPAHASKTQTEREREQLLNIYKRRRIADSESPFYCEVIKTPVIRGQREGTGGHSQRPRWRRNLLGCCGSYWVQRGASRWRWRVCGPSIGSPFACQCHGALSIVGQRLKEDTDKRIGLGRQL